MSGILNIEIVFAEKDRQQIIALQVNAGCTVEAAIRQSGILNQFINIDLLTNKVGIFSKIVSLGTFLKEGDRVEIYRPLLIDPKLARKQRAKSSSSRSNKFTRRDLNVSQNSANKE